VRVKLVSSVCLSSEGTWESYCECVRVELVSSVCLSSEGTGKMWDAADVGVLLRMCESGACLFCVLIC
jgi:hypothetical protein